MTDIRHFDRDSNIAYSATPISMMRRLLHTITSDRTIVNYVNSYFDKKITLAQVAEARAKMIVEKMTDHGPPMGSTEFRRFEKNAINGSQKLAAATKDKGASA